MRGGAPEKASRDATTGEATRRDGPPMFTLAPMTGTRVVQPKRQKPTTLRVTFLINKRGGSSYMGVGLAEKEMMTGKYLGNDGRGWMMINDGRKGHSNNWVRYGYNVAMKVGDRISIEFDSAEGNIRFLYNNHDLGLAFTNLKNRTLYPAVTLANRGDSITIVDAGIANFGWAEASTHPKIAISADRLTVTAVQSMSSGGTAVALGSANIANPYGDSVPLHLLPYVAAFAGYVAGLVCCAPCAGVSFSVSLSRSISRLLSLRIPCLGLCDLCVCVCVACYV